MAEATPPTEITSGFLPSGQFSGRAAFQQMVRDAFFTAARHDWKEIVISDPNFHDWPLGERSVSDALQNWARSGRRFTMLAGSFDEIVRRHARFVTWRRTWDHIVTCRRLEVSSTADIPSVIWSAQWVMQRLNVDRCAGVAGKEPERRVLVRESLDEWQRSRSAPGFAASTLGL